MTNREWIMKGNSGCTFATLFSKNPDKIGWIFISPKDYRLRKFDENSCIISIIFPSLYSKESVRGWALQNDFYIEETSNKTEGLRIKCKEGVAWVQYFGPDSHVKTRQSPFSMLIWCNKLSKSYYIKVGFKGILHLAHAWVEGIKEKTWDLLWDRSFKQTKKIIGHNLGIEEASKTTFLK